MRHWTAAITHISTYTSTRLELRWNSGEFNRAPLFRASESNVATRSKCRWRWVTSGITHLLLVLTAATGSISAFRAPLQLRSPHTPARTRVRPARAPKDCHPSQERGRGTTALARCVGWSYRTSCAHAVTAARPAGRCVREPKNRWVWGAFGVLLSVSFRFRKKLMVLFRR